MGLRISANGLRLTEETASGIDVKIMVCVFSHQFVDTQVPYLVRLHLRGSISARVESEVEVGMTCRLSTNNKDHFLFFVMFTLINILKKWITNEQETQICCQIFWAAHRRYR